MIKALGLCLTLRSLTGLLTLESGASYFFGMAFKNYDGPLSSLFLTASCTGQRFLDGDF